MSPSPQARAAGTRFNKERDAESVIEALRKVVDKLKGENERLRRGVGTGEGKAVDTEKRLATERKKSEKLEDEVRRWIYVHVYQLKEMEPSSLLYGDRSRC